MMTEDHHNRTHATTWWIVWCVNSPKIRLTSRFQLIYSSLDPLLLQKVLPVVLFVDFSRVDVQESLWEEGEKIRWVTEWISDDETREARGWETRDAGWKKGDGREKGKWKKRLETKKRDRSDCLQTLSQWDDDGRKEKCETKATLEERRRRCSHRLITRKADEGKE